MIDVSVCDIREQAENFIYETLQVKGEVDLKLDGKTHRIALEGDKHGETSGEYRFYTDGCPAGYVRDYRNDEYRTWKFDFKALRDTQPQLYEQSRTREFKAHAASIQQERLQIEGKEKAARAVELKKEFDAARPADNAHAYLQRKNVENDGMLKINQSGELLIPLHDADGNFKTYQRIFPDGTKKLAYGGDKTGSYHLIGGGSLKHGDKIIIAEGYATGYSIFKYIGDMARVVMAVDCGNLIHVAKAIKAKFRPKCLLIAADDDGRKHQDGKNPGLEAAVACVKAGAADGYTSPPFIFADEGGFDEDNYSDFNDFAVLHEDEIAELFSQTLEKYTPRPWLMSATDLMAEFKPTEFLIEDWIPERAQILLFGASGAGKSFVTLDMAASIACPDIQSWHGLIIEHGSVLYLNGEGHNGLVKRLIGWTQAHGVTRESLKHLCISQQPKIISDSAIIEWIADEIKAQNLKDLKLVIIDTLNRHFAGDENNAGDAINFLNRLGELQRDFNCSVLINHHTGIATDAKNRGRGSSAFKAAVDVELLIESTGSGEDYFVTLTQTKNKDGEIQQPITFHRVGIALTDIPEARTGKQQFTAVLERVSAPTAKAANKKPKGYSDKIELALKAYVAAAEKAAVFTDSGEIFYGVRKEHWREELYKRSTSDNADTKRRGFNRMLNDLGKLEVLYSTDGGEDKNGDIFYHGPNFKEYIEAAGLTAKMEQIKLTAQGEVI